MTCIAAVANADGIVMGCDSVASDGRNSYVTRLKKVFVKGPFIIGYTSSFRMGQLLEYKLVVEPQNNEQGDLEYLATTFVDAVRQCFKDGGFNKTENEQEEGGQFLVGYHGRIYTIYSDYQVNNSVDDFMAIGSGGSYALGAMTQLLGFGPEAQVKRALAAAAHFSATVCEPFFVVESSYSQDDEEMNVPH